MGIKNKLECFSRKMSFTPGYTKGVVLAPERLQFLFLRARVEVSEES